MDIDAETLAIAKELAEKKRAKLEKQKKKEDLQNEKLKEKEDKLKEKKAQKTKRINLIQSKIDLLRPVEKAWDIEERMKKPEVKKAVISFYKNGLNPYNPMAKRREASNLFYKNAEAFVRLIRKIKGNPANMGIINSTKPSPVSKGKAYIKTKYGIYYGHDAQLYLRYVIQNKCLTHIKRFLSATFKLGEFAKDEDGSRSLDDCLLSFSLFQLFNHTSQDFICEILMKDYLDEEFGNEISKVGNGTIEGFKPMDNKIKRMILEKDVKSSESALDAFEASDSEDDDDEYEEVSEDETESDDSD